MAKLEKHLGNQFSMENKSLGEQLFEKARVKFIGFYEGDASFEIADGGEEAALIGHDPEDKIFHLNCTCQTFSENKNCEHLWAAVLEGDKLNIAADVLKGDVQSPASAASPADPFRTVANESWRESVLRAQDNVRRMVDTKLFLKGPAATTQANRRIGIYAIDLQQTQERGQIFLHLLSQERLKNGALGAVKPADLNHSKIELYEDHSERDFLWDLLGRTEALSTLSGHSAGRGKVESVFIAPGQADAILRKISASAKLAVNKNPSYRTFALDRTNLNPYRYSDVVLHFQLRLRKSENIYLLEGELSCLTENHELRSLQDVLGFTDHFAFLKEEMFRSDLAKHQVWLESLQQGALIIREKELDGFLSFFFSQSQVPPIILPDEISFSEIKDLHPKTQLNFNLIKDSGRFAVVMNFLYGEQSVRLGSGEYIYLLNDRQKIKRLLDVETESFKWLQSMFPFPSEDTEIDGYFESTEFVQVAEKAVAMGWDVLAHDKKVKVGASYRVDISSGVDWFDLQADFKFGDYTLRLPQLIHALRTRQRTVVLGDGTTGILPDAWFQKFVPLIGMAEVSEKGLVLNKIQALFFSASLDEHTKLRADQKFTSLKDLVSRLQNLEPVDADENFSGELRSYQKQGLCWLQLLSEHQIGGVLADDMGLGKTIQVLALLAEVYGSRRSKERSKKRPTLVVAPKSLVFNWKNEAEKFTPELDLLIYTGGDRQNKLRELSEHQVIVTTYQTMRNDIDLFKAIEFEFLILDEAHYVKNPSSQVSLACRNLKARTKFALTGTPVENSLMDLFSILSIVTPGLVSEGQAARWVKESSPEALGKLARALSPFLLRRDKNNVLKDLPEKTEQILYCELSPVEQSRYNELKTFYWAQLNRKIEEKGLAKSKIEVLEALLRLRQAACHQGLLDVRYEHESSAKFELLLDQLEQVVRDGHKALVFSQFTTLLGFFNQELQKRNISYEYLDGQTRDREERVENFQTNSDVSVFVLSLKAGGVGLNLTAADYVFILDPWWNPAAESQAIDRSHRIGQNKKVFAYKIIAKDTIEEKILDMQSKKRAIAKAVVSSDSSLLSSLKMEDLRDLFL